MRGTAIQIHPHANGAHVGPSLTTAIHLHHILHVPLSVRPIEACTAPRSDPMCRAVPQPHVIYIHVK